MNRAAAVIIVLVSLAAGACGDGEAVGASPTSPTGSSGAQTPASGGGGCTMPSAPSNLSVTVAGTSVVLTWSAASGATEYLILVGTTPSSSNTLSTNAFSTAYPWSGVTPGTYYARIQSKNSCGTSGSSNEVRFTV